METQTNTTNWLDEEEETFKKAQPIEFEKVPPIKLVQDDIVEFDIDFSQPFRKWNDADNDTMKALIPVLQDGQKKLWWLNIKNPIYHEIIKAGREGKTHFKVLTTGSAKNTRYKLKE